MKYLCLAYGSENDWNALTMEEQDRLLAQDEALRGTGLLMGTVQTTVTTLRAWDGAPTTINRGFANFQVPLAGFSINEASDVNDVVRLVAGTPAPKAPLWNPSWSRFAGHYSNDAGETEVVELNQRLVIINSDGDSPEAQQRLEPLGDGRFRLEAPAGGGPVGESVHFVEENGRVVRMYTGESFSNRVNP